MENITPEVVLQVKDFLSLLALVWLIWWTYRHLVPDLISKFLVLLDKFHDDDENDGK